MSRQRQARGFARATVLAGALLLVTSCGSGVGPDGESVPGRTPAIVATTPVLGAIVRALVGSSASVDVLMPNGADPHEWQPSARDVELLDTADLVVANGLRLESSLDDALADAAAAGVPVFEAGDHIGARPVGNGEATEHRRQDEGGDEATGRGAADPHLWLDPLAMRGVVEALAPVLERIDGVVVGGRAGKLERRLEGLDAWIAATLSAVPADRRELVTGHESLGYFADRYGFTVEGTVIPGLSSQAQPSAGDLAALKRRIERAGVTVVFVENGTPAQAAKAVADEAGAAIVELPTHSLPEDGSYFTFMHTIATTIANALAPVSR